MENENISLLDFGDERALLDFGDERALLDFGAQGVEPNASFLTGEGAGSSYLDYNIGSNRDHGVQQTSQDVEFRNFMNTVVTQVIMCEAREKEVFDMIDAYSDSCKERKRLQLKNENNDIRNYHGDKRKIKSSACITAHVFKEKQKTEREVFVHLLKCFIPHIQSKSLSSGDDNRGGGGGGSGGGLGGNGPGYNGSGDSGARGNGFDGHDSHNSGQDGSSRGNGYGTGGSSGEGPSRNAGYTFSTATVCDEKGSTRRTSGGFGHGGVGDSGPQRDGFRGKSFRENDGNGDGNTGSGAYVGAIAQRTSGLSNRRSFTVSSNGINGKRAISSSFADVTLSGSKSFTCLSALYSTKGSKTGNELVRDTDPPGQFEAAHRNSSGDLSSSSTRKKTTDASVSTETASQPPALGSCGESLTSSTSRKERRSLLIEPLKIVPDCKKLPESMASMAPVLSSSRFGPTPSVAKLTRRRGGQLLPSFRR